MAQMTTAHSPAPVTKETSILADETRLCVFPIPANRRRIWQAYKTMRGTGWEPEEARLSAVDCAHWKDLTDGERSFLAPVLAFFAVSDGLVMANIVENFMGEISSLEVQFTWQFQTMMENVHAEVYARFIDKFITNETRRAELFGSTRLLPVVQQKTDWIRKYMDNKASYSFGVRLFAFAVVEGVLFSGSFCAIDWLRERGLMPGLTAANDFIARDEGQHTDFAALLNEHLAPEERADTPTAHAVIGGAVAIETEFITDSIPCDLIGMNKSLMKTYIKFVADRILVQFGHTPLYNVAVCPFDFMQVKSVRSKENFFEKATLTNYGKSFAGMSANETTFSLSDEF